jgi:DNA-binding NtrC family response regulator
VGLSDQALRLLLKHDYPGNLRELENIIEYAFVLCKGNRIDVDCLSKELTMKQADSSFYFSTMSSIQMTILFPSFPSLAHIWLFRIHSHEDSHSYF